jgi:hypothetical protein
LQKDFKRVQTQKSIAEILLQHNNTQWHTSLKTWKAIIKPS